MKDPRTSPTFYPYALTDISGKDYADTLDAIFRDPTFAKKMESRNKLYASLSRMPNQQKVNMAVKELEKMDHNLGYLILQALVMRSLQVNHLEETSFNDLLKKVDLANETKKKAYERLSINLDSATFITDVIESKLLDINSDLNKLFGNEIEFRQFDGVMAALRNMRAFFSQTREEGTTQQQELFCEFADSIEAFLNERMAAFIKQYRTLQKSS